MLNFVSGLAAVLVKPLRSTDTVLTVLTPQAVMLNKVGLGNHVYLELSYNGNTEVVRYDHTATIPSNPQRTDIAVTRDVEGTGIFNFPIRTCAKVGVNKSTLVELIQQALP